jgi:leucine dehydrogenase
LAHTEQGTNLAQTRRVDVDGFDEVLRVECAGTVAFVVLHAVVSGRTFGGLRVQPYAGEEEALLDALALARAMTRKVVLAGLDAGGAKAVLVAPPDGRRADAVRALGEVVESLGGRFNTGPDMGYGPEDESALVSVTRFVARGTFSDSTADGVVAAMNAVCAPRRVAVQGLGSVGLKVAARLSAAGVEVVGSDVRQVATEFPQVESGRVHAEPCDVFAPCARGGLLGRRAVEEMRCRVVCGSANNPLVTEEHAELLRAWGIVYVPDFVSSAGGVVEGASRAMGEADRVPGRIAAIGPRAREVVERSRREGRSTLAVAVEMAEERLATLRRGAAPE